MKKLIFPVLALVAMTMTTTIVRAQDGAAPVVAGIAPPADNVTGAQDQKTQVEITALPEAVKQALATDAYREWMVTGAWQVRAEAGEYYLVEMKRDEELATLKFDENGNPMG